jgi:copper homeostasis protein
MFTDVDLMQRAGVAGVVLGALTPDGEVDVPACRALLSRCSSVSRTFHRAFDLVADPSSSLEQIIAIGFDRVLSSGQRPSAVEGRDRLAELIRQAEGRIALMPGGGIRPDNVRIILDATGANEIHSSASVWLPEAGAGRDAWGGAGRITCRSTVHQLRLAIDETAPPTDHGSIFTFQ